MGEGSYKNELTAGTHTVSDEIVQVASSMDDAHDLHTIINGTVEDQICAIRKRAKVFAQLRTGAANHRVAG